MYHTALYKVQTDRLVNLVEAPLGSKEAKLQQWIWDDPKLLGEPIVLIGREVLTDNGKRIDLLGLDSQQNVCVIELKRDRTPRDVIAQALDYASWVGGLEWSRLDEICIEQFQVNLAERFTERFGSTFDNEVAIEPRMIVVASQLDETSERIARFLTDRGVSLNAVFFSAFQDGAGQLLTRSWLLDPGEVEQRRLTAVKKATTVHSYSGYWFVNVGYNADPDNRRSWQDNRRFGFMSAGGGAKYAKAISNVAQGAYVYAYLNQSGYVGFGEVISQAVPISQFTCADGSKLDPTRLEHPRVLEQPDDLENCEYAIGVRWISTRDATHGVKAPWHSIMTVCALNQPSTLEFLRKEFELTAETSTGHTA